MIIPLIESEFDIYQIQIIPQYFFQGNELFLNQTLHSDFICVRNGLMQYFPTNTIELNRYCLKQREHAFLCKNFPTYSTIENSCEGALYFGKGDGNCDFAIQKIHNIIVFQDIMSAHDFHIAHEIANVVCGGDVDPNTEVTEAYLMTLERRAFGKLLASEKSQARIMGMMSTGKPLRN